MARSTFPMSASRTISQSMGDRAWRSRLAAPLRQQGEIVGVLNARRIEVRPFTPEQIKLLETFADQASSPSRTSGYSKSLMNHWSNKRPRVKFWALSLVRQQISSQC